MRGNEWMNHPRYGRIKRREAAILEGKEVDTVPRYEFPSEV